MFIIGLILKFKIDNAYYIKLLLNIFLFCLIFFLPISRFRYTVSIISYLKYVTNYDLRVITQVACLWGLPSLQLASE